MFLISVCYMYLSYRSSGSNKTYVVGQFRIVVICVYCKNNTYMKSEIHKKS